MPRPRAAVPGGGRGAAAAEAAKQRKIERIRRYYARPGHATAFSAPATVAKHFNVTHELAKEALEHEDAYTLHREYKKPRTYNPFYVHRRREQVQADLIDVSKIQSKNDGIKFLLVLIDIFTKKLWVYPLKNKSGPSTQRALREWAESLRVLPKHLVTDRGLEFRNAAVQTLLREKGIDWYPLGGSFKASIAERVNKTLQVLIFKYLTHVEGVRYIDVLPQLVRTYNRRPHRTLKGATPNYADLVRNEKKIQAIHHARYEKVAQKRKTHLPFKVGDLVRIKTEAKTVSSSRRAYAEQFQGEFFRIMRINRTMPIAMYHLRSLDTGDLIEGGFYANELQRQRGDVYKIERVFPGVRRRNGVREVKVRWKYFGPQHDEWIREDSIVRAY